MKLIGLTQRVEYLKDRNERRDCLDQAWTHLLWGMGFSPIPLTNCTDDAGAIVSNLNLAGVILTGGNDLASLPSATDIAPERDIFEEKLLTVCSQRNIPVLGVCRGLQMMVVHYGGTLSPVEKHTAVEHGLEVLRKDILPLTDRKAVNSYHNFGIKKNGVGTDLLTIAAAPDGTVEAVAHQKFPQWGIMWHPERPSQSENDVSLIRKLFA